MLRLVFVVMWHFPNGGLMSIPKLLPSIGARFCPWFSNGTPAPAISLPNAIRLQWGARQCRIK